MAGKNSSKLHEKHQLILANMLREEENKYCADCHAKGPRWASWNLGVFMCIRCAGIHRNLGVHISRVKSVNLDSWTPEQITAIQNGGNGKAMEKYEASLPANFRRPQDDYAVEQFIRSKYERKLYVAKEAPVSTATESRSSPAPSKVRSEKKQARHSPPRPAAAADNSDRQNKLLSVPRPPATQNKRSPSPTPPSTNLISMETSAAPSPGKPQSVDLLTDMRSTSPQEASPWQSSPQQPSLGDDPQKALKANILSLYQTPSQTGSVGQGYQSYTAHGYPVHPYHYQQQQMVAMRMAQQQLAQQQVKEVEEKMRQLKMQQGQPSALVANGQPFLPQTTPSGPAPLLPQAGGHTLNPHLW